jgi:glycosyltransferase involved in cell wall biosynthesis
MENTRVKVGFLITDYSLGRGGERVCITLVNALSATYEVHLISLYQSFKEPFFPVDPAVTVHVITPGPQHSSFLKRKLAEFGGLKKHVSGQRYDFLVGVASYPAILLGLMYFPAALRPRRVAWEHSNFDALRGPWKFMRRITFPKLDAVVCLSEEEKRTFEAAGFSGEGPAIHVIPNALSFVSPAKSALQQPVILSAGALEEEKGFDLLIRSFALLHTSCPDWRLEIYGEGTLAPALHSLIAELGLRDSVALHAPVKDLKSRMLEASIYVMPSRREGFGMVLVEAMECGLACVSFDCPTGPRNIISDNVNGVLVPPQDTEAMAQALQSLIGDPEHLRRLAEAGSRSAKDYALTLITTRWVTLFGVVSQFDDH